MSSKHELRLNKMVKVFIYKDYDLVEEIHKIYMVDTSNGSKKDKMLRELEKTIKKAVEVNLAS